MKVEIEIPSNLSEISLDRYQKYMLTLNNSDDKEFVFQKMIEIFCGLELKEVAKMKASTVIELVQHFNKIFNEKTEFKHRFKLNDVELVTWYLRHMAWRVGLGGGRRTSFARRP